MSPENVRLHNILTCCDFAPIFCLDKQTRKATVSRCTLYPITSYNRTNSQRIKFAASGPPGAGLDTRWDGCFYLRIGDGARV